VCTRLFSSSFFLNLIFQINLHRFHRTIDSIIVGYGIGKVSCFISGPQATLDVVIRSLFLSSDSSIDQKCKYPNYKENHRLQVLSEPIYIYIYCIKKQKKNLIWLAEHKNLYVD
jgi:hypothetical protein